MLDENGKWHDMYVQLKKKKQKISGYRAKYLLNQSCLKCISFAYIHSYLNYANIAWASTYQTKLKAIQLLQKCVVRIMFNENNMTHSRSLLRSLGALNVCKINLFQHLRFMYNFNKNETPIIFNSLIKKPFHKYPTKCSRNSFSLTQSLKWLFNKWGKRNRLLPIIFKIY